MPTARSRSPVRTALWPTYYPPALRTLSDPRPHPEPAKLPPSIRYSSQNYTRTLQDDLDDLDNDEDNHYNQVYDLRQCGHSWLVPLGRQRTHDEEVDSQYYSSPNHQPTDGDLSFSPPLNPPPNGGTGNNNNNNNIPNLNLGRPLDPDEQRARRQRRVNRLEPDEDEEEEVLDLDAEIEDADATRDSDDLSGDGGDEDDDPGTPRGRGGNDGEESMDM
ncbi:hypothetical protein JCM10908_004217 [Rhodotorula pacifica]|uniref:uncharacterized protein n=1 Tax=Rhodotorula pacifica TaxID=1495444 RepID=UPI00316C4912